MFFRTSAKRKTSEHRFFGRTSLWRPAVSGIEVNSESAYTYSAFYSCVRIISESIAYLPWHVMIGGSKRQVAKDHPLEPKLYFKPNDELNSFQYRELLLQHALSWGNSYAEIERARSGKIVNLWPIDPSRVCPERDSKGKLYYQIMDNQGGPAELRASDVFHVRGPSRDGINGYSIIDLAKESISLGLATEAFGAAFFGNGAIPGAVIKNEGSSDLDSSGVKNLLSTFNKKHKGPTNSFRTEYLSPGLDIKTIGIAPEDAQFLESRKFQISEICRWFRIPPHKLAQLERATHSNIEAENIGFVTDSLMPWVSRIESQVNFSLLDDPLKYYNKINVNGILRGDAKARAEYYKILAGLGVLSIDEIRDREDMDSIGPDGDLRLVPLNMTTPEKMKSGDFDNVNSQVTAIIEKTAKGFAKVEIARTKKLADKKDLQGIADFYINHARALADGFENVTSLFFKILGSKNDSNEFLKSFFGDYITQSADQLQNSIENDDINKLFCSWDARKAENLTRDLINGIKERARPNA